MEPGGQQFKQLHQALLSAFPDRESLKLLIRTGLNENLESIAGGGNLSAMVYDLIVWAEAQGRLEELVRQATMENPGNPKLHQYGEQYPPQAEQPPDGRKETADVEVTTAMLTQALKALQDHEIHAVINVFIQPEKKIDPWDAITRERRADTINDFVRWAAKAGRLAEAYRLAVNPR